MNNNDYIRRWNKEKATLSQYLLNHDTTLECISNGLEQKAFSAFIGSLAELEEIIERGISAAQLGKMELSGKILVQAKLQKDTVYIHLMKAEKVESLSESCSMKLEAHTQLLRDYIMKKYNDGVEKSIEFLEDAA